jgi:hypothetical protein
LLARAHNGGVLRRAHAHGFRVDLRKRYSGALHADRDPWRVIYPIYRVSVRFVLEQSQLYAANGSFELKEHFVAVGLGMLPVYWYVWRQPLADAFARTRTVITGMLAFIVWWSFLVGHILNNIRGLE